MKAAYELQCQLQSIGTVYTSLKVYVLGLLLHQNVAQLEENDACLNLVTAQLHSFESTIAACGPCAARRAARRQRHLA